MTELSAELQGLDDALSALDRLSGNDWIREILSARRREFSLVTTANYDRISKSTPYSPAYIGRLKPSRTATAGGAGDSGYAIDTRRLYGDLTGWTLEGDDTLESYSDAYYAGFQANLLEQKIGETFWGDDEIYLDILETGLADAVEEVFASA